MIIYIELIKDKYTYIIKNIRPNYPHFQSTIYFIINL